MIWISTLSIVAASTALAALLGWLVAPWLGLLTIALAFAGYAAYQALATQRLHDWLQAPRGRAVPVGHRRWGEIFDSLARFVDGEKQARTELSAEIDKIRAVVDRLPDGLVVLDANYAVQWCNQAAENLHGIFTVRRPVQHFIREPEFVEFLAAGRFETPLRLQLAARPGRTFEFRIHVTDDGHRLLITRDISEQARVDVMRSDFVANVSHEIRTPVTVIGGFAETLLTIEFDAEKRNEYLDSILRHSRTMQRLVDDLLMLSSLEAGAMSEPESNVAVDDLFSVVVAESQALSDGRHRIVSKAPANVSLRGHPIELESAVRNLMTNAIRYTPEGGTIELRWSLRGQDGWISVQDDGIGIAPEHIPRLSERFYRVDRGRSRSSGGTGLGLAIVKRIASRHNATLHIESQVGVGSTFSLIVPASRIVEAQSGQGGREAAVVA